MDPLAVSWILSRTQALPVRTKKPGIPICSICSIKKRTFYFIRYLIIYSPFFPYFPYFFTLFLQYFHLQGTNGTNGTNTEKPCFYWCFCGFNLFRIGGPFGTNGTNGRYLFHPRAICSLFVPYLFPICSLFVPSAWNKLRAKKSPASRVSRCGRIACGGVFTLRLWSCPGCLAWPVLRLFRCRDST